MDDNQAERATDGPFDVSQFAEGIRRTLRELPTADPAHWRAVVEQGIGEGLRQHDLPGLAAVIHLAVNILDGQGRYQEAVEEVDYALELVRPDPDASAVLWGIKASLLVTQGNLPGALGAAIAAEAAAESATSPFARRKAFMYALVARCCALQEMDLGQADATLARLYREGEPAEYLFLASWYIPYLFCVGQQRHALPLIRAMRLQAETSGHRWRRADAFTFSIAEVVLNSGRTPTEREEIPAEAWISRWRLALLEFRTALWNSEWHAAEEILAEISALHDGAPAADLGDHHAFQACLAAYSDQDAAPALSPPESLHQWNLATTLAGAEAIAMGGTQAEAGRWLEWMTKTMPSNVATSLEWPMATGRLRGLLALRAGNPRLARREIEEVARWASASGYPIESALAQVELAELLAHSDIPVRHATWEHLRKSGWKELQDLGIDPLSHAYRITRLVAQSAAPRPRLSPREGEVLALLATGCSYRDAAQQLGLTPGTVQTLVHRAYEKLGVSGKIQAIDMARQLGIL